MAQLERTQNDKSLPNWLAGLGTKGFFPIDWGFLLVTWGGLELHF